MFGFRYFWLQYIAAATARCYLQELAKCYWSSTILFLLILSSLPLSDGYDYDVFLSFAEEEREFAERSFLLPLRRKGYSVFWHHEHFVPGYDIGELICNGIHSCRRIILICMGNFARSNFCLLELRYSLAKQRAEGRRCIIPVVFEGQDQWYPRELQGLNQIRLRQQDLSEDEIDALVERISLGKLIDQLHYDDYRLTVTLPYITSLKQLYNSISRDPNHH